MGPDIAVDAVDHGAALLAGHHQLRVYQLLHMIADGWLRKAKRAGDLATIEIRLGEHA